MRKRNFLCLIFVYSFDLKKPDNKFEILFTDRECKSHSYCNMNSSNYSEVYAWFEKSGIISNIRTHLRQNLVNALKSNTLSRNVDTDHRSAKQYVYDMLIAEYLLNYNYTYTLSVFASEAPLLINFHHQSAKALPNNSSQCNKNKLPNDYVCHTLQTLGINPKNTNGQSILSQYAINQEPLIICIIKYLTSNFSNKVSKENDGKKNTCMQNQQTQTDYLESTKFHESIVLSEAKDKLYQQKELFATQLKTKELELREQAQSIERQLVSLNEKLQHAQNLMHLVDVKESDLARDKIKNEQILASKELELAMREKLVGQEADRLQKERDSYRTFEIDMRKLQEELAKVRNELPGPATSSNIIKRDSCVQTDICDNATKVEDTSLLDEEKQELSSLIREQQSRIEELTLRAITLARQLEEAQLLISPKINPSNSVVRHVNVNTIFSESSSTEDILQDAKMRLRRLEEESLRADQYFYNCITTSP